MALSARAFSEIYERLAPRYDRWARIYWLMGFNEPAYKRKTVAALDLKPGDTVVDIGCGTGLNFPYLLKKIGPTGRIIGVDLTPGMLAQAALRIEKNGWQNIELVQMDAAEFEFSYPVDAVLSTFALTFVPGFEAVIRNGFAALAPGGKFAVLDMKKSDRLPRWLTWLGSKSTAAFGVTLDLSDRKPWEVMAQYSDTVDYTEYYTGSIYSAVITKS